MRLTVLGVSSGGVPGPGGAGSGYLLQAGDATLLVDCGNGVLGHLKEHVDYGDLDGVYVSHLHADHVDDLMALALWARFRRKRKLPLWGPPGTRTLLYRWFTLFRSRPDPYVEAFDVKEVQPWSVHDLNGLKFQACPVEHSVPTFGLRAEFNGKRFVYSADTKASALVVEAAQNADLFLCEATYQGADGEEASRNDHMTATEAGEVAHKAGVRRLLLTHLLYELDPAVSADEATRAFGDRVEVARVGETYTVD